MEEEDPSKKLERESESGKHKLINSPSAGEESTPSFFADDEFAWPELSSSGEVPNPNAFEIRMYSVPSTPESTPNPAAASAANDDAGNLGFSEEKKKDEAEGEAEEKKTKESTPSAAASAATDEGGNLGFSEEKKKDEAEGEAKEKKPNESTANAAASVANDEGGNLGFSEERKKEEAKAEEKKANEPEVVVISTDDEDDDDEVKIVEELSDDSEDLNAKLSEFGDDWEYFKAEFGGKASELRSISNSESTSTAMECLVEILKNVCESDEKGNGKKKKKVDILETVKRRGMTFPKSRWYDS
ncbi:protein bfr2-like [Spinacia oleracea]|uniref:Protein bfr2-like n=1 Tax=Spinacia oleracea TaxID=3562 RepID=A0A9R0J5X0_SPIOL|nr:protein bfr2-like [Spinacia oleracea]